jgi:hypothetical protein
MHKSGESLYDQTLQGVNCFTAFSPHVVRSPFAPPDHQERQNGKGQSRQAAENHQAKQVEAGYPGAVREER